MQLKQIYLAVSHYSQDMFKLQHLVFSFCTVLHCIGLSSLLEVGFKLICVEPLSQSAVSVTQQEV